MMTDASERNYTSIAGAHGMLLALGCTHKTRRDVAIYSHDTLVLEVPKASATGKGFEKFKPTLQAFMRKLIYGDTAPSVLPSNGTGNVYEAIADGALAGVGLVRPEKLARPDFVEARAKAKASVMTLFKAAHESVDATAPAPPAGWETATWDEMKTHMLIGTKLTRLVYVSPAIANEIVGSYNTHNRDIRERVFKRYAHDIARGAWGISHQGIAFSPPEGTPAKPVLLDGQHRLYAIDEAGRGIWSLITVNLPPAAQEYIDEGVSRRALDVLRLSGRGEKANKYAMSIATRMFLGVRSRAIMSRRDQVEMYERHLEAITFVTDLVFQKKKRHHVMPAPVGAVIARASYHVEHDRLLRVGEVILSGVSTEEREAVLIHLRNWLMEGAVDRGITAQRISREVLIYMKTQRALMAYLNKEKIERLYPMREEAFMLPGEVPHRADAGQQRARREP